MPEVNRQEMSLERVMNGARQAHSVMTAALQGVPVAEIRDGRFRSLPRFVTLRSERAATLD
jgi:hypothetical protein